MAFHASVHAKAIELTKLSIEMTTAADSGHTTSAASLAHLVTVLRNRQQRRPMTREDVLRLRDIDSEIDGHPNPAEGFPFFPEATGSLGQELSIAAGLAMAALDATAQQVGAAWTPGDLVRPPIAMPTPARSERTRTAPAFHQALQRTGQEQVLETGKLATRKAYGIALQASVHTNPQVVALDGDVRNSTYAEYFSNDPALRERFFECKKIPKSGRTPDDVLRYLGLSAADVAQTAVDMLAMASR